MPEDKWDALPLSEKVEKLRRDLDELIRIERNNVDARASQRRDFEMRLGLIEESIRKIEARLAALK
jgi:hypothetical protein